MTGSSDRALGMKCQSGNIPSSSVVTFLPQFGTSVHICLLSPWVSLIQTHAYLHQIAVLKRIFFAILLKVNNI